MKSILLGGIKGVKISLLIWSGIVVLLLISFFIPPEGWESAGFMALLLSMPTYELFTPNEAKVFGQVILMFIAGYIQWGIVGLVLGFIFSTIMYFVPFRIDPEKDKKVKILLSGAVGLLFIVMYLVVIIYNLAE